MLKVKKKDNVDAIYIHIPFCVKKCNYCDFLSFEYNSKEKSKYIDYLLKEISLYPKFDFDTVYFGGGTPSLLEIEDLEKILKSLNIKEEAEITLEVNPKTVDFNKLKDLKRIGINRLSIGCQSFSNKNLRNLGRIHKNSESIETYFNAREAEFLNINLDLMFSLPEQNLEGLEEDLKTLIDLNPEHISIYSLIWEEGTKFWDMKEKGLLKENDNDLEAFMYEKIIEVLEKNDYIHYEISNFSKKGFESRHNTKYWENKKYLAVGLGASGYIGSLRYKNISELNKYYEILDKDIKAIDEEENDLIDEDKDNEYENMLSLRLLKRGKIFCIEKDIIIADKLVLKGLLNRDLDGRYTLTKRGLFIANEIFAEFID